MDEDLQAWHFKIVFSSMHQENIYYAGFQVSIYNYIYIIVGLTAVSKKPNWTKKL